MKNLKLKTFFLILIASAFMVVNAVGIAADSQTGTTKQKKKEEIKPPSGEKWYEEEDEELYKFDIHPVTPKKGITGGILIYYGNFVKPPYKVELIKCNSNCEDKDLMYKLLINGLPISPGPRAMIKRLEDAKYSNYSPKDNTFVLELLKYQKLSKKIYHIGYQDLMNAKLIYYNLDPNEVLKALGGKNDEQ